MRYRLASTVPGMKRALSSDGWEAGPDSLFRLVSVGADVGVSIGLPQEPQNRFPSGTSLAHDGHVATIPSSRQGRRQVDQLVPCAQSDMITRVHGRREASGGGSDKGLEVTDSLEPARKRFISSLSKASSSSVCFASNRQSNLCRSLALFIPFPAKHR